jgi:DNA-binding protein YbaB
MLDDGRDLDAAEGWVDNWQSAIEERAAQAQVLSGRLAQLTASARSDDGWVEVTVGSSGAVTRLQLDERVRGQSAATTSEQILATVRAAQANLTRQAAEATAETMGADSETGLAIVDSFTRRFPALADGAADADR